MRFKISMILVIIVIGIAVFYLFPKIPQNEYIKTETPDRVSNNVSDNVSDNVSKSKGGGINPGIFIIPFRAIIH